MRADRISVNSHQLAKNLTRREENSVDHSRRNFLRFSGAGLGVAAVNSIFPSFLFSADQLTPEAFFEEKLQGLIVVCKKDETVYNALRTEFLSEAKKSPIDFMAWYKDKVASDSKDPNFPIVLEDLGNQAIRDFASLFSDGFVKAALVSEGVSEPDSNQISVKKSQYTSQLLSSYNQLILKNPTNKEIIQKSLQLCDFMIFPNLQTFRRADFACVQKFKTKQVVADDLGNQIISLYDSSLKGVKALHEADPANVDKTIKSYINEIPWDSEGFDDRPDLQDKIVDALSANYLSLKRETPDVEGLEMMLSKITGGSSFTVGSCNSGWSPYIVFNLIEKNPDYFESVARKCAESIKDLDKEDSFYETAILIMKFFSRNNLVKLNQQFRFTSAATNGIPPVPVPEIPSDAEIPEQEVPTAKHYPFVPSKTIKNVVNNSSEKICKPVIEGFVDRIKIEKVKAEDKDSGRGYTERFIDDKSWLIFNRNIHELGFIPELHEAIKNVVDDRLSSSKSPYETEMLYLTRGNLKSVNFDLKDYAKALENAESIQAVRGLAYFCLSAMSCSEQGKMSNSDFWKKFTKFLDMKSEWAKTYITPEMSQEEQEKVKEKLKGLDFWKELEDWHSSKSLTEAQKFFTSALRISYGNYDIAREFMPHRKFPPVEMKITYRESGVEKTIQFPIGSKELRDKERELEGNKSVKILNQERIASKECQEDYRALFRMMHNSTVFLIYMGALATDDSSDPRRVHVSEQSTIKKVITDCVEEKIKYEVFYNTMYQGFDRLGEKVGALLELYESNCNSMAEYEKYLTQKKKALSGLLFKHNEDARSTFGVSISLFEDMKRSGEENAVRDVANKNPRKSVLGTKFIFDDLFNFPISSFEHKKIEKAIKETKDYEDMTREIHRTFEGFKARLALGCMNTARHKKLQETRETLVSVGDGYVDNFMTLDPVKYMQQLYKVDITKQ